MIHSANIVYYVLVPVLSLTENDVINKDVLCHHGAV